MSKLGVGRLNLAAGAAAWWAPLRQPVDGRAGRVPPLAPADKSIAVLPFDNFSEDKDSAFFADGVQDEVLTDLSKIADLKVISRSSVMQYRKADARNLREIGKALGVADKGFVTFCHVLSRVGCAAPARR